MGKDIWKPGTVIYPVPAVMVSCGTMEQKKHGQALSTATLP